VAVIARYRCRNPAIGSHRQVKRYAHLAGDVAGFCSAVSNAYQFVWRSSYVGKGIYD
jgi:hypothetical protein